MLKRVLSDEYTAVAVGSLSIEDEEMEEHIENEENGGHLGNVLDVQEEYEHTRRVQDCLLNCWKTQWLRGINLKESNDIPENEYSGWRVGWKPIYVLLFESSTIEGQLFDLTLLLFILLSVTVAVADSVKSVQEEYGTLLLGLEIIFTFLFTIECALRIICIQYPTEYLFSMMGIVDATSIVPTYLGTDNKRTKCTNQRGDGISDHQGVCIDRNVFFTK